MSQPVNVELTDTMGFPDPNPEDAAPFYDMVVSACREEKNVIVWVVSMERDFKEVNEAQKALLEEFTNVQPPIIMVVNMKENFGRLKDKNPKKYEVELQEKRDICKEYGWNVAERMGVNVQTVIACPTKDEFEDEAPELLMQYAMMTQPKVSNLKTFAELLKESEECKSEAQQIEKEEKTLRQSIAQRTRHLEIQQWWGSMASLVESYTPGGLATMFEIERLRPISISYISSSQQEASAALQAGLDEFKKDVEKKCADKDDLIKQFHQKNERLQWMKKYLRAE